MSQKPASIPEPSGGSPQGPSFDELARGARAGFFAEFLGFLRDNKKWWLALSPFEDGLGRFIKAVALPGFGRKHANIL